MSLEQGIGQGHGGGTMMKKKKDGRPFQKGKDEIRQAKKTRFVTEIK